MLQTLRVRRLYDDKNNTLIYVAYSTRLDGSKNVGPSPKGTYLDCISTPTQSLWQIQRGVGYVPML